MRRVFHVGAVASISAACIAAEVEHYNDTIAGLVAAASLLLVAELGKEVRLMAMGHCKVCEKLVTIVPKGPRGPGRRQEIWKPVEHEGPDKRRCSGVERFL